MKQFFIAVLMFAVVIALIFSFTYGGRIAINKYNARLKEIDEATCYDVQKEVEDTCRVMQASYQSDKLTYEQYNGTEHQSWADMAKMRANKTAATYNEYMLTNSHAWAENVPNDIAMELEYIN